ncbi:hypothetical protein HYX10_00915 [Candidatus Woesearchaeota archaeon]|nr:hypothetical protein [Candidatus Woesearchaeota archaeon]
MKLFAIAVFAALMLAAAASAEVKGPQIDVKLINQNPDPVEPGDDVELRFRVDNNISATVDDVEVELLAEYPFTILGPALKNIGSLDASQKGASAFVVKYRVFVESSADEGEHPLYVRYRIGNAAWSKTAFDVSVEPADAILGVVSADDINISSGSVADFGVTLKNYGKSLVKDVRVKLDLGSTPLFPLGNSNEVVIESIAAGASETAAFKLVAAHDAASSYYKTGVQLHYLDDSGKSHLRNASIGIVVYDKPVYSLAVKESDVNTPDSNGEVVISVSNTGPAEIRFMEAELLSTADYRVLSAPKVYLGNLEADDFETAEFSIRTAKVRPGNIDLRVKLTHKDSLNREIVNTEVVQLPIYSGRDAARFGLAAKQRNYLVVFAMLGVQVIAAVFVLFMLIDCQKNSMPKYKKTLWTVVILTGIGAVLYYFLARRKK